jgi:hypothetical protein
MKMYCKYCGGQLDEKAAFCSACGKSVNGATPVSKTVMARVLSIVLILLSFYGFFADALTITDEGGLNPAGFIILLLLAGCAIAIYKTRVYLINIICFGALSVIYLVRIINLQVVLVESFGRFIDFDSYKTVYWIYFIALSILTAALVRKYRLVEKIKNFISHFKYTRIITLDEMNSIVLSALHEKRQGLFLIIGLVCCSYIVLSNLIKINLYVILRLIPYIGIGVFLYALHSNIGRIQPFARLNKDFNIALCTFIIQICSNLIYMITLKFWRFFNSYFMLILIIIVVNIGLSFCFYKICRGFKGKQNTTQLKISIYFSMAFLCTNLVLDMFKQYYIYRLNTGMHYYSDLLDPFWIRSFISNLPPTFIITKAAEYIVMVILVLFFRNMLRNLNVLTNNTNESEERSMVM